jgi:ABC-type branched-subunit amino acid transport system substrate-binding protein
MTGVWPVGPSVIGALELAVRDANANPSILRGRRLEYVWRDDGCDRSKSLAQLSEILEHFGPIDCLIGPGCSGGCELTGMLAGAKRMPQISPMCTSSSLSDKIQFPFFARTTSPYSKRSAAIVALMQWAAWTRLSIVGDITMQASIRALYTELDRSGLLLRVVIEFETNHFGAGPEQPSRLSPIRVADARAVMVFAFGHDLVAIAAAAGKEGMAGGWAWLGLDMVSGVEQLAIGRRDVTEALHGWVYFQPHGAAGEQFWDRVKAQSIASFGQPAEMMRASAYAANLYDAVMLYANIAGSHPDDLSNGELIFAALMNASFDGMTGKVEFDRSGDMQQSIEAVNYLIGEDGAMYGRPIGVYDFRSLRYVPLPNSTVVWPGGVSTLPVEPIVGSGFNTVWLLVGAATVAVLLVGGMAWLLRRNRARLEAVLLLVFTEVTELVGSLMLELADVVTDAISCSRMLNGDSQVSELYRIAYTTILICGVAGTILSIAYRIRNARLVARRVEHLGRSSRTLAARLSDSADVSAIKQQLQKYEWELAQTHRSKVSACLALMTVGLQGASANHFWGFGGLLCCPHAGRSDRIMVCFALP